MSGGEAWQVTKSPTGVQQYAWRPGGKEIAFVAQDEAPKRTGEERHNRSFEVQNNHFLLPRRRCRRTCGSFRQRAARRAG